MKKKASGDHLLAIEISKMEGKKQSLSIAQIKEVIKCLRELAKQHPVHVFNHVFFK